MGIRMFEEINGNKLFTVSFGSGEKTILGLSGFVADWRVWTFAFESLSVNWRCVSYDHRGVGESPVNLDYISIDSLVDDVFGVMNKLNIDRGKILPKWNYTLHPLS